MSALENKIINTLLTSSKKGHHWFTGIFTNADSRKRWIITIGLALIISIIHLFSNFLETPHWLFIHSVLTKLYFLPVLIIALWDGERPAYKMSLILTLFFLPYTVLHWSGPPEGRLSILAEVVLIWAVSAIAGKLADKLRALQMEKSRLQTTKEVSKVLGVINGQILVDYEASLGLAKSLQPHQGNDSRATSTERILLNRLERLGSHLKNLGELTIPETRPKQNYSVMRLLRDSKREINGNGAIQISSPAQYGNFKVPIDRTYMTFAMHQIIRALLKLKDPQQDHPLTIDCKNNQTTALVSFRWQSSGNEQVHTADLTDILSHPEYGYSFALALSIIRAHGGTFRINSTSSTAALHLPLA